MTSLQDVCDPLTASKYAKEENVSIEKSRELLEEYLQKNESNGQLWALYEICGVIDSSDVPFISNPSCEIRKNLIVPQKELEIAKAKFKNVISTKIYSIQRTNPKETRIYGRQWDNNDDLANVKVPTVITKKVSKPEVVKEEVKEKTPEPKSKPVEKKSNGLMSMFTKKPKEETIEKKKTTPVKKVEEKVVEKSPSPVFKKKRVRVEIDEDDDIFDKADTEPKLPTPKKEKSPEKEKEEKKPKRKRALNEENVSKEVNKTIECSPEKSPEKPKPKISAPPPGQQKTTGKKNASIMSFFKKV
ncbi:unnamed protein product [Caenorhabditis angaria]|uniref:DNA polymerase delta subunit 3 n=1 Tax=Caenorhabditis angaria TaxID=860376 RepID=A0A9P1IXU2_9PELO|nr:unnamed protein product [Caenorhabditis angaria]